jgi:hypothetical protein
MIKTINIEASAAILRCLLYLLAIADAELVTFHVNEVWGVSFHLVILFGLVVHSTVLEKDPISRLLLALGLVPFIRVVT